MISFNIRYSSFRTCCLPLFFRDRDACVGDGDGFDRASGLVHADNSFRKGVGEGPGHCFAAVLIEKIYHDGAPNGFTPIGHRIGDLSIPLEKGIILCKNTFL